MNESLESLQAALGDRYEVIARLGSGGMAHVFLAKEPLHGRDVALKILREELSAAVDSGRFLREIDITSRLSHPNIRPLLDFGVVANKLFYVMPFIPGETLSERISAESARGSRPPVLPQG